MKLENKLNKGWKKFLNEAQAVPGETTPAQLRDDPALSGYRSGATTTREIPADYGEEEGEAEPSRFTPEQQKVIDLIGELSSALDDENFQSTSDIADYYAMLARALKDAGVSLKWMTMVA